MDYLFQIIHYALGWFNSKKLYLIIAVLFLWPALWNIVMQKMGQGTMF